jgi:hypothetical protein
MPHPTGHLIENRDLPEVRKKGQIMPVSAPSVATKQSSMSNRRSSRRMEARRTVTIEVRKGSFGLGPNIAVELLDVSEGGVRVVLKTELHEHDEVEVLLMGYGIRKAIKRVAAVSWSVKLESGLFAIGLHFEKRLRYQEVSIFSRS